MTSRSFRRLFPQLNVQSIPEDEFYRQASLSQLLTGPDEQELASFRSDIKDPLELVEATPELAGMLGSSLEFVDTRWDALEFSPPPMSSPPSSPKSPKGLLPRPPQCIPPLKPQQGLRDAGVKRDTALKNRTVKTGQFQILKNLEYSTPPPKTSTKMDVSLWEVQQLAIKKSGASVSAKSSMTLNANVWESQQWQNKNTGIVNSVNPDSKIDSSPLHLQRQVGMDIGNANSGHLDSKISCSMSEPQRQQSKNSDHSESKIDPQEQKQCKDVGINSANLRFKTDSCTWQQQQQGTNSNRNTPTESETAVRSSMLEPQRSRSRNAVTSDSQVEAVLSEQQRISNKNSNSTNSNGTTDVTTFKVQNQGKTGGFSDSTNPGASVGGRVWESQRLQRKNTGITSPTKPNTTVDVTTLEHRRVKRTGSTSSPKREANYCDSDKGAKTIKMDATWQKNLGNVRVHIRDLGMKVVRGNTIQKDAKKEQGTVTGKSVRAKTRS